jgi:hypothetical protein
MIMNYIQLHALGMYAAVNGVSLSRSAARSSELRRAADERKLQRKAQRRQRRGVQRGREAYTTAV